MEREHAVFPPQEAERLAELYRYEVLDTGPDQALDDLVHLAASICQAPIAVISLVDAERQWFKSKVGLTETQTARIIAFCAHTILGDDLLVVPDAQADPRFTANPLVVGEPHIRFYCGAPLTTPEGHRIGTLGVIDRVPRELVLEQREAMRVLSHQVMDHLNLGRRHKELVAAVGERLKAEQALLASQTKFQRLSDCTSSGIYIYSGERFLYANPAAQTITGYSLEELKSLSLWDLVHPDFHEALKARTRAVEAGDQAPARFEFPIIAKDGQIRWLDFTAASIEYDGQPARIGTAIDITARKQAESALRRSEERFALAVAGTDAGIWDRDIVSNTVYYSPRWKSMLGYDEHDLPDVLPTWEMLIHPDDRARALAAVNDYLEGKTACYELEHRLRHKDGRYRWILARGAVLRDATGKPLRMAGSHLDVTERKQAELLKTVEREALERVSKREPLSETMEFLVRSIESLSDGGICSILLVGPDGRTLRRGAAPSLPEAYSRAIDGAPIGPQNGSCGTAVYRKALVVVADIATDALWAPWTKAKELALRHGLMACTSVPIMGATGEVLGTYAMYYRDARGPTDFEMDLLRASTHLLSIAIDNLRTNEALRITQANLGQVLKATKSGTWDWNIITGDVQFDDAWLTNLGYDRSDLPPHVSSWERLVHPEDVLPLKRRIQEHFDGKTILYEFVNRLRRKDGTYQWNRDRGQVVERDGEGRPLRMVGTDTDITEQAAVTEQAMRWEQVFAKARFGLAYGNIADNTLLAVNEVFASERGYTVGELVGKPILSLHPPEVREEVKVCLKETDRLGHLTYESVHQRKDGTTFPVLMEVTVITNAQGKPISRVAYALDITERQRTQRAIQESEERFRLVAEVTNDVLWDWDLITNNHWWSPNAREKFGYDPLKEPSIEAWRSRLHPRDRRRVLRHVDECLKARDRAFFEEYQFRMADGSYGTFWDKGQVVYDAEGKPVRMIGAMIDITAAKRAYASLEQAYTRLQWLTREVQRAEEKERRRLSRELHDEFGQLLSALRLSLARVREDLETRHGPKERRLSKNILAATKTAEHLFTSLRELVHGLRPAVLDEFGLVSALESMVEDIRQATGLDCRVSIQPDNVDTIIGEDFKGGLFRIAQELTTNVVRHAKATKAVITLCYADGTITLTVQDDGQGGCRQTAGKYGLRSIQERTELLGGALKIRSDRRRGTVVTVMVPVEPLGRNQRPGGSVHPIRMRKPTAQPHGR